MRLQGRLVVVTVFICHQSSVIHVAVLMVALVSSIVAHTWSPG